MIIEQKLWTKKNGWTNSQESLMKAPAQLVLMFGAAPVLKEQEPFREIRKHYPYAHILGCSTAGEIYGTNVFDDSLTATAVHFEHTTIQGHRVSLGEVKNSFDVGKTLAGMLDRQGLRHVFVLSDGINVNGSELVKGLTESLPENIKITGGLAGDGERFTQTFVFYDGKPEENTVAALGFYGDRLNVGYGSVGGWDPFGPERLITRAKGNVLYELDGKSALELYKTYLGEHAKDLPASGLLFPLSLRSKDSREWWVVRTILAVNEDDQSMTFAGDVPEGMIARLMKANFDRLIDGAVTAAKDSHEAVSLSSPGLAVLISCVGRKMILGQRIEEEVEGVRDILGGNTVLTGFYSYGEISPFMPDTRCELHNQTMTITTLSEI